MKDLDPTADARRERERRQAEAAEQARIRKDVQKVMQLPESRRILWRFLQAVGYERSAFSPNAMTQSRAIGLQEGGQWWIDMIREFCPEQESAMRAEARVASLNNEEDGDDE